MCTFTEGGPSAAKLRIRISTPCIFGLNGLEVTDGIRMHAKYVLSGLVELNHTLAEKPTIRQLFFRPPQLVLNDLLILPNIFATFPYSRG